MDSSRRNPGNIVGTRCRRPGRRWGGFSPIGAYLLVYCLLGVSSAWGQDVSGDARLEELRRRTPGGATDDDTIDTWLNSLIADLNAAGDAGQGERGFHQQIQSVRQAPDTTRAFNDTLAARAALVFKAELDKGQTVQAQVASALVRALTDMDTTRTIPGLVSALSSPAEVVRYLAARGLERLRDRFASDPNLQTSTVASLRAAGVNEMSSVVVTRIYLALSFQNARPDALDAMAAVLAARIARYRTGLVLPNDAERVALEYLLSQSTVTQTLAFKLVQPLAVLLRLDVDRYAGGSFAKGEREAIELRVFAAESLLESLVSPAANAAGHVSDLMQQGRGAAALKLELIKWIGSAQSPGLLNGPPWNVLRGVP